MNEEINRRIVREELARDRKGAWESNGQDPTYAWEASADINVASLSQGEVTIDLSHHFTPQEIEYFSKGR